jgi:hypothetical protein
MRKKNLQEVLKQARPTGTKVYIDVLFNGQVEQIGHLLRTASKTEATFTNEEALKLGLTHVFVDPDETNVFDAIPEGIVTAFARASYKKAM